VRVQTIHHQPQQSVLKRHDGQRHTACMRYISAPQRSHFIASSAAAGGRAPRAETTGVTMKECGEFPVRRTLLGAFSTPPTLQYLYSPHPI
jgi:hypothetical protein